MKKMYIACEDDTNFIAVNEDGNWYADSCISCHGFWGDVKINTDEPISEIAKKLREQVEDVGGIDIEGMLENPEFEGMTLEEICDNFYNGREYEYILVSEIE